ncbi:PAS domain-containing sensor histidine kinase [Marivibrio halodurans]|uniref:histidine kinase n=1 Tax=Marivibrio halodurans TaxID=2039722 RepID=A0A8J7S3E6_9PROT|nr:PAS domain-containing sensor histidine kinase [Marivibrio halodurans]MBP5857848.1 PAS domain-containing sensor histidine kinase [Marivibrio halodurans]
MADSTESGGAVGSAGEQSDLVSALPIGVYRTTPSGRLLLANKALADIYGYPGVDSLVEAAAEGKLAWYADPDRRDAFVRLMESWGEIDRLVSEVQSRDGRRIWVSETARFVRDADDTPLYYEGTIQDITDLLSVQRALRESERRFRDYAEIASDWFWEMDETLCFSYFSDTLATETGIDPQKLLGRGRPESALGDTGDPHWQAHLDDLKNRRAFYDFRYPFKRPDNHDPLVISASGVPIFDENGVFRGYRGVGSNVTEEARVQQSLYEAKLQAEFANRAKSDFIANVSHELRTPLNAILGFTDIMRDELFGPIGVPRYTRYLEDIHTSASHLLSIINMILDLSKIEAGKLELDDVEITLDDCIRGAIELINPLARERQVRIEFTPNPDIPTLIADERALRQMLLNLLSNAVKFSESRSSIEVAVDIGADGEGAVVRVSDVGMGIPEDKLDLVTQPFGHTESSLSRSYEGSGLGLAITRRLIELHDGALEIESTVGQGTTVRLIFPKERRGGVVADRQM